MTSNLQRRFRKLEEQKRMVLDEAGIMSREELRFRPEPSAWSVIDVLDHLVKVEQAFLGVVQKQLPHGTAVTLRHRVGAVMVIGVMRSPIRVKVPAGASMVVPAPTADLAETAERWRYVREELTALLDSLRPEQLRCGLFRHPVSGWMTMSQGLLFLSAHLRHHGYQLNRLKKRRRT